MAAPAQIDAPYGSVWRFKRIHDAKYRFLYQIGGTVYYSPLSDDSKEFITDVSKWLDEYERIDI